uniref:Uncharacterized protein n=1 Tax=Mycena chlorophos TaxID=658473 RepID=A0ABQ0LXY4_MYCCL|nr:predicted protein [Mycena chlorophos]
MSFRCSDPRKRRVSWSKPCDGPSRASRLSLSVTHVAAGALRMRLALPRKMSNAFAFLETSSLRCWAPSFLTTFAFFGPRTCAFNSDVSLGVAVIRGATQHIFGIRWSSLRWRLAYEALALWTFWGEMLSFAGVPSSARRGVADSPWACGGLRCRVSELDATDSLSVDLPRLLHLAFLPLRMVFTFPSATIGGTNSLRLYTRVGGPSDIPRCRSRLRVATSASPSPIWSTRDFLAYPLPSEPLNTAFAAQRATSTSGS